MEGLTETNPQVRFFQDIQQTRHRPPAHEFGFHFEKTYPKFKQLRKAVEEFRTYIGNNRHLSPNDGERYRNGEAIATGFVASTVNQVVSKRFCKNQQMQ